MPPSPAPSPPHEPPRALIPQECSHDTHYINPNGDLFTALITGGSTLLLLKNGVVLAQSGPLLDEVAGAASALQSPRRTTTSTAETAATTSPKTAAAACAPGESAHALPASASRVCAVSLCSFTEDVLRVAVATTTALFVLELDDAGRLWCETRAPSLWRTAEGTDTAAVSPSAAAATSGTAERSAGRYPSVHGRSHLFQTLQMSSSPAAMRASDPMASGGQTPQRQCGSTGRLRWRRVGLRLSSTPSTASPGLNEAGTASPSSSSTPCRGAPTSALSSTSAGDATSASAGGRIGGIAAAVVVPVRISAPARSSVVRVMDFVSADTLCVVLDTEAVLIVLGNSSGAPTSASAAGSAAAEPQLPDRVVWRSMGAYRSLAVCRVNHHVALALGHATMVIFTSCTCPSEGQVPVSSPASPSLVRDRHFSTATSTAASPLFAVYPTSGGGTRATVTGARRSFSVGPTPAFSPTSGPALIGGFPPATGRPTTAPQVSVSPAAGAYITLAERALTTSVGIYHIDDMRWHCVSSHTLLCVTCTHPQEETAYMMLYTVQSLPTTRWCTNVMEECEDGGWGLCRGDYEGEGPDTASTGLGFGGRSVERIMQLIPTGVIALTYTPSSPRAGPHPCPCPSSNTVSLDGNPTPSASAADALLHSPSVTPNTPDLALLPASMAPETTWGGAPPPSIEEMHTSLVPNFSRSAEANSMSSRMEFVHVEDDGTVRTSSYSFGRQKHASFAKQRAVGLACRGLLQPLLRLYSSLVKVTVLPTWRMRPIELGHDTGKQPCAVELLLGASRRYRMVLRFASGVVLAVMVDLSAAVYRVECFLALGCAPLLSLRTVVPLAEAAQMQRQPQPSPAWSYAGLPTILIAGLLGFPATTTPHPAESPRRRLRPSPSFLEVEEAASGAWETARQADEAIAADTAAPSHTASAPSPHSVPYTAPDLVASGTPARTVWGVVVLQVEPSSMQARVLTVAPLTEVLIPGASAGGADEMNGGVSNAQDALQQASPSAGASPARGAPPMARTTAPTAAAASGAAQVTEENVVSFMTRKCPDKLRFMPALLKAAQQDAGRLLTHLVAKYGALEEGAEAIDVAQALTKKAAPADAEVDTVTIMPRCRGAARSLSVLASCCIDTSGELLLLVRANTFCDGNGEGEGSGDDAALIRLRPPCLEALAPVHRLVAAGGCYIPFEPVVAEYVFVPAEVQQRWWSKPLVRAQVPSAWGAVSPSSLGGFVQGVREAFCACQRVSVSAAGSAVVRCEVVSGPPGAAYVRVRSPLSPDNGEAGAPTFSQRLLLPTTIDPLSISCVIGALLVNNDVVIGVLCRTSVDGRDAFPVLYLYGCPAVQSLAAPEVAAVASPLKANGSTGLPEACLASSTSAFALEATLPGVDAFYLNASGEVVLLRRWPLGGDASLRSAESAAMQQLRFERWLRCFPRETHSGYSYVQDGSWCPLAVPHGGLLRSRGRGSAVAPERVTALMVVDVAGACESNPVDLSPTDAAKLGFFCPTTRHVLYATADSTFIHVRQLPFRGSGAPPSASHGPSASVIGEAALPQYHPDSLMQLIGMARWSVLAKVLACVADALRTAVPSAGAGEAASAVNVSPSAMPFGEPPEELARRLCTSAVARGFQDRPQVVQYEEVLRRVTPPRLSVAALREEETLANATAPTPSSSMPCTTAANRLHDFSATCGTLFSELSQLLPQVTLSGLDSHEQLKLLCILEALRDTLPLSRSVDEAAARHLFYSRYMSLARRLRLKNMDALAAAATDSRALDSVLHFEVGRTATRTISTASYLWAAMSDSQSTLVSLLFDKASPMHVDGGGGAASSGFGAGRAGDPAAGAALPQELTWEQVKRSGVAFWLRCAADLRAMADRVARHQYQSTKDLTACALMYCTARKVGTLAALAKAQSNQRLHCFFSRDFSNDAHSRAAASANAYAAISKNMPEYGAAFFLLAGDVRSAVQVLLQRCRNASLALFVLRAASDGLEQSPTAETPLEWYIVQREAEAEVCGALDMWELACLSWLDAGPPPVSPEVTVQRRIRALQRIAAHPTAHPEALCALRYARDCVAALAYRGDHFLSPACEVVCLLRLGRYCLAHRLSLNGYLHYRDAEVLLRGLRAEAATATAARSGALEGSRSAAGASQRAPPHVSKMAADFNTGTLLFRRFGSDSDDDDGSGDGDRSGGDAFALGRQDGPSSTGAGTPAGASSPAFTFSEEAAAAAEAEVQYAYARTGAAVPASSDAESDAGITGYAGTCEDILRRMLLSFTAASPFMTTSSVAGAGGRDGGAEVVFVPSFAVPPLSSEPPSASTNRHESFQQLLTSLLRLLSAGEVHTRTARCTTASNRNNVEGSESAGAGSAQVGPPAGAPPLPQREEKSSLAAPVSTAGPSLDIITPAAVDVGWRALCVPLLHFLLSEVALRGANYIVLLALQQVPISTEGVLKAAVQAKLLSDDSGALQETCAAHATDAASSASAPLAATPHPLRHPLTAFFLLLLHHVRRHYRDACEADGSRLGGGQAATSRGHRGGGAGSGKGLVLGVANDKDVEAMAGEDDAEDSSGNEENNQTHQSIFDALLAAAAEARRSNKYAARVPGTSFEADGACGSLRSTFDADGTASDAEAPGDSVPLRLTDSAQVSLLLSCCQAQQYLRLMEHLRQLTQMELSLGATAPTTQRTKDGGAIYAETLSTEVQAALQQRRVVLCTLLLDVATQWSALSEECMLRIYAAQPQYAPGPLTDPNGIFLEVQQVVKLMRAVLVAVLAAPPLNVLAASSPAMTEASTAAEFSCEERTTDRAPSNPLTPPPGFSASWVEDHARVLVELCATQLELLWSLPPVALAQCRQLAAPTDAAVELLQEATASHASARALLERLLRPLKVVTDPLGERSRPGNLGTIFSSTGSSSQSIFSIFSAATTPVSSSYATRAESPLTSEAAPWPSEPHPSDGRSQVYCPALSYMQLAWMRRHHTHAMLRSLLLMVTLGLGQEQERRLVSSDRLILAQHNHSVTGVHFDASSCDSVVWTTEAGTSVGHGFRELLAGDNEEALWKQATERNLATAAFTLSLTAQNERLRLATERAKPQYTPAVIAAVAAKSVLESRPRFSLAANAMPSSHPHLPFFVSRHLDGHLDLYPFASQECVASFCCAVRHIKGAVGNGCGGGGGAPLWRVWDTATRPAAAARPTFITGRAAAPPSPGNADRHAVIPVAFSPSGYIIAAGLSDGSVAGWRFAAAAVESPPAFFFPQLFAPFGIRACTFCGDRSSLVVVVGTTREPHRHRRDRGSAVLMSDYDMGAKAPPPALDASSPVAAAPPLATAARRVAAAGSDTGEMVGEVLVLDTMLDAGAIMARCALPFIPSYAVFITPLRAVLVVSVDGMLATYEIVTGRLVVLGTVPVTTVLRSTLGPSLGAGGGDAGAGVALSASSLSNSDAVYVTCVARSNYDPLVALGLSNGLVLLLHLRSIGAAMARTERRIQGEGEDTFAYYPPHAFSVSADATSSSRSAAPQPRSGATSSASAAARPTGDVAAPAVGIEFLARLPEKTVLTEATCMQVAPHVHSRSAIEDLVFSPSMLLAGLRDGKVMATSLIARATRTRLTSGCAVPSDLLECAESPCVSARETLVRPQRFGATWVP
ncbi:hypothetical protein LSCM1_07295 [Leishmania martiniquensis]|uniref:RAVE complex protein Rav1 C-terminal domain-containing protein n=1 Tax=Leishmania martiniquensis TaxID=1580590 RepID=A0A836HXK6_9TRYP|nr:hypothetical protein LSCM1_07295 [Leishmania martiniquensis]